MRKNGENRLSAVAESLKMKKNAFRPRPKNEKRRKRCFGHGRKMKNEENGVSGTTEESKTTKAAFRPWPKLKNRWRLHFQPLGSRKLAV